MKNKRNILHGFNRSRCNIIRVIECFYNNWRKIRLAATSVLFAVAMVGCGLISNEDASQAIAEGREGQRLTLEEAAPLEKEIQLLQDTAESLISDIDDIERQLEGLFIQEENIYRNEIEPLHKQIARLDSELNKVNQSMAYEQSGNAQSGEMSKVNALELQLQTIRMEEIRPLNSQREDIQRSMDFDRETRDQISPLEDEREALKDELEDLYDKREDLYDKREDAYDSVRPSSDDSDTVRNLQNNLRDLDASSRDIQKEASEARRSYDDQTRTIASTINSLVDEQSEIDDDQAKMDELNESIDLWQTKLRDLDTARSDKKTFYQDQVWALSDERDSINQQLESYYQKEEDNRDAIDELVDAIDVNIKAIDVNIKALEDQSKVVDDSINAKYKEEFDRIKELEKQLDDLEQQMYDIQISKVKPLEEEFFQLINESQESQNAGSSDELGTPKEQDMPEEIKVLLLDQDNLRNQIEEIEETKMPAIRDQIDALRVERLAKRDQLSGIHDDMKPKVEKLNEIQGEIDSKRAALEGTILDILEAANEKYNKE